MTAAYGQTEPERLIQPVPSGGLPTAPQIDGGITTIPAPAALNAAAQATEAAPFAPGLIEIPPAPMPEDDRVGEDELSAS